MDVKARYIQHLRSVYPELATAPLENLISDNLLSPFIVNLPRQVLSQIQAAVQVCSDLRENTDYQGALGPKLHEHGFKDRPARSIMMSYDFHLNEQNQIKLIEINTNASFLILGSHFYQSEKTPMPVLPDPMDDLKHSIAEELKVSGKSETPNQVAIIDEQPEQQRLYVEFILAQAVFRKWNWRTDILDSRQIDPSKYDFIYNRDTDFFIDSPDKKNLKTAAQRNSSVLSPHPVEYFYLADKGRLMDWSDPDFRSLIKNFDWNNIDNFLLKTTHLDHSNKDEIWQRRKSLFFKPAHGFGSKSSYRGQSISHKIFEELAQNGSLAQEFCPAPELEFKNSDNSVKFKFDLRCYAYKNRLQSVIARLYQGQVTNLQTPLGGFARVQFN